MQHHVCLVTFSSSSLICRLCISMHSSSSLFLWQTNIKTMSSTTGRDGGAKGSTAMQQEVQLLPHLDARSHRACTGRPAWIHLMMCTWYSAEGLRFAAVSEVLFHFCVLLSFITISTPSPDLSLMKAAFPGPRGCIWLYFCLVFVSLPCNELIYVADSCTQFLMFGSRVEITCSCFSIVLMQTPMTSYYCSHV